MNTNNETNFRAGFVAVIGRPNVGKSTLMNTFLGQKVAAVSLRPQTTRRKQLGILTSDDAQIVFVDTPGLHNAHHKLGEYMNEVAQMVLEDADVILWLVDASVVPDEEDRLVAARLNSLQRCPPVILVLNKVDVLDEAQMNARQVEYQALFESAHCFLVSASLARGTTELLQYLTSLLPQGQPFYAADQVTDFYERDIAAELVREAALLNLRDEVPHGIAVRVDEFTERGEDGAYIAVTVFVEKESHKGIVIGRGGEMLKKIGSAARREIETMSGRKVFLELRVKVNKNWRNDPDMLRAFGFTNDQGF